MNTPDTPQPLTVRLAPKTLQAMRALAKRHKRSLNSEIVWAVEAYITMQTAKEEKPADVRDDQ